MAQTNYTPILLYASGTATNVPLAANLTSSASGAELALNYADGKLFYKDSGGVVQVLATKGAGTIGGSNTQVQFNNAGALGGSASLTWNGTVLTSSGFSGPLNGTVGATTANTGSFTTVNASTLSTSADITVNGLTVGRGAGAVATNTAVGASALATNSTASNNTAVGYQAGYSNVTGVDNTFVGNSSGYYQTGLLNTFVGWNSGLGVSGSSGTYNTAVGARSLNSLTSGGNNSALGEESLYSNTTGSYNTGIGCSALYSNTTASNNTAVGYQAGLSNTTGTLNTFVGRLAGYPCTTGSYNTCLGDEAGYGAIFLTTGTNNVYIGYAASGGSSSSTYEVVIGGGLITGKGSNTGFIAPGSTANSGGGAVYQGNNSATWSITSDQRLKKNIVNNNIGLDVVCKIQVRNFEYRLPEEINEVPKEQAISKTGVQLGVIAQEIQTILPDCVKTESTGVMSVDTDNLTWYMVNAIKELKAEFDAYKATHP
jgi:hypothetical protein